MHPVVAIFFAASMLVMSAVLIRGVIVSRRAVKWHAARVEAAVDRVIDRMVADLERDGDAAQ